MDQREFEAYQKKSAALAEKIIAFARNSLLVDLRFLDEALCRLQPLALPDKIATMDTDGKYLFYNPGYIFDTFMEGKEELAHDYLHVILHCIFQHPFTGRDINIEKWNLACDIATENIIWEINLQTTSSRRVIAQQNIIEHMKREMGILTAEKIYRYLLEKDFSLLRLKEMHRLFKVDGHTTWYDEPPIERKNKVGSGEKQSDKDSDQYDNSPNSPYTEDGNPLDKDKTNQRKGQEDDYESQAAGDRDTDKSHSAEGYTITKQLWKNIGEKVQVDLETLSKMWGNKTNSLTQSLKEVNRQKYSYADFLRKFMVFGEKMEINDNEFDYISYTYGLELFGDMPLIEPLEYNEVKNIKELAIVIDTSSSVQGEQVQRFVEKTYNILQQSENFFTKINLHIIQCDTQVKSDIKITNVEEFDTFIKDFKIRGLGGTDFRAAFKYVDELIEKHEFTNFKGLIYFTDGFGVFPEHKPDYEAAFVFVSDEYEEPQVPPWAIKLMLPAYDL